MRFSAPLALLLLLVLPLVAWLGWPGRGPARRRELLALVLRLILCLSLILALAGLELVSPVDDLAVVFLLDASDSLPPAGREAGLAYIRQALQHMGPNDQAAVLMFGGDALVERPMSSSRQLGELTSTPDRGQTDLGAAIRLGLALYPPHTARRMVLLSDGLNTRGDALTAARLAAASGVQIQAVPLGAPPQDEVRLTTVDAPRHLQQGERFDLQIGVNASRAGPVTVRVLADGQLVFSGQQQLQAGEQAFSLPLTAQKTGFSRYQVQIEPQNDHYYQNNSLSTFTQVAGPPRLLVVAPPAGETLPDNSGVRPDESAALVRALRAASFSVDQVAPYGLPADLVNLASYAAVILVDTPARQLSPAQMSSLQSYVRDLGGGLVVVGGPTSYGVGGYYRTPLEETLPVEMHIKDTLRRPTLAMVFIIDHSGSMAETSGGVVKLELAKEAAIRSVELLYPGDRVGVIAFDENASWVVPMTDLANPGAVQSAIATLRPGGGTDILAGVQAMSRSLPQDPARVKHVVLLTDGGADATGIPELVRRLHDENDITLSAVGVGKDAAPFLPGLAQAGGGRYHFAADPASIPSIFTEETTLATRAYLIEHPFFPAQANPSPILSGIQAVPQLQGYVGVSAKDTAQTILVSDQRDPILVAWQYGLGRSLAFTSDATGRWAQQWLNWDGFADFWAQAVRYTIRDRAPSALQVSIQPGAQGGQDQLLVEARSATGDYLNGYRLQARLVAPDGNPQTVALRQVAPGQYIAGVETGQPGAYLVAVTGDPPPGASNQAAIGETAGWALPYSAEYRSREQDERLLERITALAGGVVRTVDDGAGDVFAHTLPAGLAVHPVWNWLLALAAALLPLDIAARRLLLNLADVRRLLARLRPAAPAAQPARPPRSARLDALFQAKERAAPPAQNVSSPRSTTPTAAVAPPVVSSPEPGAPPPAATTPPQSAAPEKNQPAATTAASLLAAKRERKKDKEA